MNADARAVEQVLIAAHGLAKNGGTLLNEINAVETKFNGIAAKDPINALTRSRCAARLLGDFVRSWVAAHFGRALPRSRHLAVHGHGRGSFSTMEVAGEPQQRELTVHENGSAHKQSTQLPGRTRFQSSGLRSSPRWRDEPGALEKWLHARGRRVARPRH